VPLAKQTIVTDSEGGSQQWRQGEHFRAGVVPALPVRQVES